MIPALDEAERIVSSLEAIRRFGSEHLEALELIVVDDGSTDGTADVVRARFGDEVRVLVHPARRGKGAAVRTGVLAASEPWILFADADLSMPIEEVTGFLADGERAPIVIASKRAPGTTLRYPLLRRLGGGLGHVLISALVVRGFTDTQAGFKLFRADVARELFRQQRLDGFGFDFEVLFLARRLGHDVLERPFHGEHKAGGSISLASYAGVLREIAAFLRNRWAGRYPRP